MQIYYIKLHFHFHKHKNDFHITRWVKINFSYLVHSTMQLPVFYVKALFAGAFMNNVEYVKTLIEI
jgi:hypothetical protein